MKKEQTPVRTEVLSVAHDVLRRRGSARIIEVATSKGAVGSLLAEYRGFIADAEKQLQRDGIRVTGAAVELLRSEWSDTLLEHRRPVSALRA